MMSQPRAASLIPLFYVSSLVLLTSAVTILSYPVLLLAHSLDHFSLNLLFLKGRLFCVALVFFVCLSS